MFPRDLGGGSAWNNIRMEAIQRSLDELHRSPQLNQNFSHFGVAQKSLWAGAGAVCARLENNH